MLPQRTHAELLEQSVDQVSRFGMGERAVLARLFGLLQEVGWHSDLPGYPGVVRAQSTELAARARVGLAIGDDSTAIDAWAQDWVRRIDEALLGRWRTDIP